MVVARVSSGKEELTRRSEINSAGEEDQRRRYWTSRNQLQSSRMRRSRTRRPMTSTPCSGWTRLDRDSSRSTDLRLVDFDGRSRSSDYGSGLGSSGDRGGQTRQIGQSLGLGFCAEFVLRPMDTGNWFGCVGSCCTGVCVLCWT